MSLNTIPDGAAFDIYEYINEKATPVGAGMTFDITLLPDCSGRYFASQQIISFLERPGKG